MALTFDECLAFTLTEEGGYANNPHDTGGPTNMGITLATLSTYLKRPCTASDVQHLTKALAANIYKNAYWNPIKGDQLPLGVNLMVFDEAVNAGVGRSIKILQKVVGTEVDGNIGPETLAATFASDPAILITNLASAQVAYYKALSGFHYFGEVWLARTNRRRARALVSVK